MVINGYTVTVGYPDVVRGNTIQFCPGCGEELYFNITDSRGRPAFIPYDPDNYTFHAVLSADGGQTFTIDLGLLNTGFDGAGDGALAGSSFLWEPAGFAAPSLPAGSYVLGIIDTTQLTPVVGVDVTVVII